MPQRIVNALTEHVKKDRALQKAITYRLIVAIGAVLIFSGSWVITNNPALTIIGGSLIGEGFRTGIFYIHEKAWENNKKPL